MSNTIYNRTKIVATMGPSTKDKNVLVEMIRAGVDVCRINFSHGTHEQHAEIIKNVRAINEKYKKHVGIIADLQGPKIRIGQVENNHIELVTGQKITITNQPVISTKELLFISYDNLAKDVSIGENILLDDGKLQLKIVETTKKDTCTAEVIHGGVLSSNKGVNLPHTKVSVSSITDKDLADLEFALSQDVEWVALSFVRKADDIIELKRLISRNGKNARVIAKIEKPEAIKNIDAIIEATDGIMVARGDLGVELPMEDVPVLQKQIVKKCTNQAKPVIIATQMLESMITSPRPTRAEANDVANSVLDGADAVMVSGETSVGDFPVLVIETMQKIITKVEESIYRYKNETFIHPKSNNFLSDNICYTACLLAEQTDAKAIVTMTSSGYTAFQISSHRPKAKTYTFTSNQSLLNTLSLIWGVRGFYYDKFESTDKTISEVNRVLKAESLVFPGDVIINTAAIPIEKKGKTNMLKVSLVE